MTIIEMIRATVEDDEVVYSKAHYKRCIAELLNAYDAHPLDDPKMRLETEEWY
jgi:hypothetical protein